MGQKIKPECFVDFLLFARDEYTTKHCQTVAVISQKLAADLKFSNNIIEHIVTAAYLHDIGKITWDDTLLKGSNQASSQEWLKIKNHPEIAGRFLYQMLSPVLKEHERLWIALVWVHHWKYVRDDDDYPPPSVIHGTIHPVLSACHLKFEDETWDLVRGVIQVADCFHAAVADEPRASLSV